MTSTDTTPINKTEGVISKHERDLYFITKLSKDVVGDSKTICSLIGVTKKTYNKLATYQQRVEISDLNKSVSYDSTTSHNLLDVDNVKPPSNRNNNFHDYTCVFSGEVSPPVDDYFTVFPINNSLLTAHCKFAPSNDYQQYVPLLDGLFQASLNILNIKLKHMKLIQMAINIKSGFFDRRKIAGHNGSLSYIGIRSQK